MLTSNIIIEDQLINGQMRTMKQFQIKDDKVRVIYLELDG